MSVALAIDQVCRLQKTVVRDLGWTRLKPGEQLHAIVNGARVKRGEQVEKIGEPIRVVSVRWELLGQ